MPTPVYVGSNPAAGLSPVEQWRAARGPGLPVHPRYLMVSKALGLLAFLLAPLWFSGLLFAGDYDYSSAIGLIPLLLLLDLGLAVVVSRRDVLLRFTLLAGSFVKAAGAAASLVMCYRVYDNGSDALHYFTVGQNLVNSFWARGEWPVVMPLWSTNLINTLTAYVVILLGPSLPAVFVFFAMLALWGAFFFYRAFCIAFPEGNRGAAAVLLFFLPSLVFWTASIGKDAVIALFLGLVAYGFALVRTRPNPRSYLALGIGLLGVMAVRPHVAAMLGSSLVIPYLVTRNRRGVVGSLYKIAGIGILLAASVFLVSQAQEFLQVSDFNQASSRLEAITRVTRSGGSAFGEGSSLPVRIAMAPFLLFRPLPWEAHNLQSAVAALEGLALLVLFWQRRRELWKLVRGWRGNTYVLFILLYAAEFCLTFSAASSNFGTLSRMRAMLLPFALMLLCAAPTVAAGRDWPQFRRSRQPEIR